MYGWREYYGWMEDDGGRIMGGWKDDGWREGG